MGSCTVEEADHRIKDMTARLDAIKRRGMKYAIPGRIYMGENDEEAKRRVGNLVGGNVNLLNDILAKDFVGSPQTIADRIQRLSDIGFDYIIFQSSPGLKTLTAIEENLIPIL